MTEEELLNRCRVATERKMLHWVSEVYGFGRVIRQFAFYPTFWPLNIYLAHGLTVRDHPAPHELSNSAPVMFYFSPRLVKAYNKLSSRPCHCLISPNVFYRRSERIERDTDAIGTLAFLAHTTQMIEDRMNLVQYANELKALPEKYQPVSVCLHFHDVNKGVHKTFYDQGFNVVTVGNPLHEDFVYRFYDLIRKYRYSTSNEIGSYSFYSTEMGIPFFLYGSGPELYNHGDPNVEIGKYDSYKATNQYKKVKALFENRWDEVTPEQRQFVEEELGVYHSVSRVKMAVLLYMTYFILRYKSIKAILYKLISSTLGRNLLNLRKLK